MATKKNNDNKIEGNLNIEIKKCLIIKAIFSNDKFFIISLYRKKKLKSSDKTTLKL
tara:strand:+ start:362 stop:529 length:168 start_codon:yes stop_codon:yes gene_type:complete